MQRRAVVKNLSALMGLGALGIPAFAATYPDRPLKLIVPFPPGGPADNYGRIVAAGLATELQQAVVVDNRPGVSGALGVQSVARSPADGYTIGLAGTGATVFLPLLTSKVLFDTFGDLTFISGVVTTPNIFIVGPSVKAADIQGFIAEAKRRPGEMTIASTGVGSSPHILAALFQQKSGTQLLHVPYKGAAPAIQELIGGQVDAFIGEVAGVIPFIQSGKARALFCASATRSKWLPQVFSAPEVGLPDVTLTGDYGLVAPAGLDPAVVQRLASAAARVLASPEVQKKFDQQFGLPDTSDTRQYTGRLRAETQRWRPVVQAANITLD